MSGLVNYHQRVEGDLTASNAQKDRPVKGFVNLGSQLTDSSHEERLIPLPRTPLPAGNHRPSMPMPEFQSRTALCSITKPAITPSKLMEHGVAGALNISLRKFLSRLASFIVAILLLRINESPASTTESNRSRG